MEPTDTDAEIRVIEARLVAGLGERYEIQGVTGVGGAAYVFRALDRKHGRPVAIKVLRPELAVTVGAKRFLQEIRISANLSHPHILPLHDSGDSDGLLYYVMPFVEGQSLREYLEERGPLPLSEAVRITREAAQGIDHAHAHGIMHRDIKPENVLMSGGVAVVADFGIARAIEAAGATGLTQVGPGPSTPRYASPEQLWNDGEVDSRTDQYSLACLVFEMLTGKPPFKGTMLAVASQKAAGQIPSAVALRPDLPEGVDRALQRALSVAPGERFPDAGSFVDALAAAASGRKTVASSSRRTPLLFGAAAVVVLAGLLFAPWRAPVFPADPDLEVAVLAVLPFTHVGAPETQYFTDGMTDEVASRIGQMNELSVISIASSRFYDARVQSLERIGQELGATHVLTGSIRIDETEGEGRIRFTPRLIRIVDERELWSSALEADLLPGQIFDAQIAVAEEVARALDLVFAPASLEMEARPTESLEAYGFFLRANPIGGQFLVAGSALASIAMYEQAVALDPEFARAFAALSRAQSLYYYFFDRTPERFDAARQALERARELAPEDPEARIAEGYLAYWGRLDYPAATRAFLDAGAATSSNSELLWVLASVQRRQGNYEEALRTFQRAARLDPRSALNHFEVAGTLITLRRYDEALPYARRSRTLAPDWTPSAFAEASLYVRSGQVAEARAFLAALASTDAERLRILPQLVEEVINRPFWEVALGEDFERLLAASTSGDFNDRGAYFVQRVAQARRLGDARGLRVFADSAAQVLGDRLAVSPADAWARIDLAGVLGLSGRAAEGRERIRGIEAGALATQDGFRGPIWGVELARTKMWLGDRDGALEALESLQRHAIGISGGYLLVDPTLSALSGDPRFEALVTAYSEPVR